VSLDPTLLGALALALIAVALAIVASGLGGAESTVVPPPPPRRPAPIAPGRPGANPATMVRETAPPPARPFPAAKPIDPPSAWDAGGITVPNVRDPTSPVERPVPLRVEGKAPVRAEPVGKARVGDGDAIPFVPKGVFEEPARFVPKHVPLRANADPTDGAATVAYPEPPPAARTVGRPPPQRPLEVDPAPVPAGPSVEPAYTPRHDALAATGWHALARSPVVVRMASPLRRRLCQAGFYGPSDELWFFAVKIGLALLLALAALGFAEPLQFSSAGRTAIALLAAVLGFLSPDALLKATAEARQERLRADLPDLIDLIVTCLEAGLGLDAAVSRATQELGNHTAALSFELSRTLEQWSVGRDRREAVEELRRRTAVDDLAEFMASIDEARREGTTITDTLRGQAEAMRKEAAASAEAWAKKIPILVAITMAIFVLPAAFAAVLGPTVVQAVRMLLPVL
jgi:tight adherence protein C